MRNEAILRLEDVSIEYQRADRTLVKAVNRVNFDLAPGEILGIVGESGCGKSTLAKGIMGLAPLATGAITFDGVAVSVLRRRRRADPLLHIQLIFQDSAAALNPRRTIGAQLAEAIEIRAKRRKESVDVVLEVAEVLEAVGLPASAATRYSHEFSGGQRQRIALARALASKPRIIVADEPISALDASAQAYAANLLVKVCREQNIALVFISHDLAVVRAIADRVLVMYLGRVVESGPTADVWNDPLHPYAQALIEAIPVPDGSNGAPRVLAGEVPDPANAPSGCVFHPRCAQRMEACSSTIPVPVHIDTTRTAACLLVTL
jgi:oligopeptide/dipeptide ABC transporter ATP-binding protein